MVYRVGHNIVSVIKEDLEAAAEKLSNQWLTKYRVQIKSLSDERQEVYRQIREMSADPLDVNLAQTKMWLQMTTVLHPNGKEESLRRIEKHLLCDKDGRFPIEKNTWEEKVMSVELARKDVLGWYRNPSRASQDSLGVTYDEGGDIKIVRPDFIFFARLPEGAVAADIIDPHGTQFGDALPKMKGLAKYAEKYQGHYRRIEVCAEIEGVFLTIDLTEESARKAVMDANSIQDVYRSMSAREYS